MENKIQLGESDARRLRSRDVLAISLPRHNRRTGRVRRTVRRAGNQPRRAGRVCGCRDHRNVLSPSSRPGRDRRQASGPEARIEAAEGFPGGIVQGKSHF